KRFLKIRSLFEDRCITCHAGDGRNNNAKLYPLDEMDKLKPYLVVKTSGGMSLTRLAQTTHVHLLGFSMLYGLTVLIFSFTSYPAVLRYTIAPLALLSQLVEISCWWLSRVNNVFSDVLMVSGAIVAVALMCQVIGSLFDMYHVRGKLI